MYILAPGSGPVLFVFCFVCFCVVFCFVFVSLLFCVAGRAGWAAGWVGPGWAWVGWPVVSAPGCR